MRLEVYLVNRDEEFIKSFGNCTIIKADGYYNGECEEIWVLVKYAENINWKEFKEKILEYRKKYSQEEVIYTVNNEAYFI